MGKPANTSNSMHQEQPGSIRHARDRAHAGFAHIRKAVVKSNANVEEESLAELHTFTRRVCQHGERPVNGLGSEHYNENWFTNVKFVTYGPCFSGAYVCMT